MFDKMFQDFYINSCIWDTNDYTKLTMNSLTRENIVILNKKFISNKD